MIRTLLRILRRRPHTQRNAPPGPPELGAPKLTLTPDDVIVPTQHVFIVTTTTTFTKGRDY